MTAGLADFFYYNLWANRRLIDACKELSDSQLDATASGTSPTPPLRDLTSFPGFDELRRRAESSGNALITIAKQPDLDRILSLDEGTYEASSIIVLIQAINHAVDHRSQIATLLSQQGIEPPDLDGWAYNDAMR